MTKGPGTSPRPTTHNNTQDNTKNKSSKMNTGTHPNTQSNNIMMSSPNLDEKLGAYDRAFNEAYQIGLDVKGLNNELIRAMEYSPLKTKEDVEKYIIGLIKSPLDKIVENVVEVAKDYAETEFDRKKGIYESAVSILDKFGTKYSDKEKLLDAAKKLGEPDEVIKALDLALSFGKTIEDAKNYLTNKISEIEKEKEDTIKKLDSIKSELDGETVKYVTNIAGILSSFYEGVVNEIRDQVYSDRKEITSRLGRFGKGVIEFFDKYLIDPLRKLKEGIEAKAGYVNSMINSFAKQGNIANMQSYMQQKIDLESQLTNVTTRLDMYETAKKDIA